MHITSRFDSNKDAINLKAYKLSLTFGDRIFEDDNHMIMPSIRPEDREGEVQRGRCCGSKAVHWRCSRGGTSCPASYLSEGVTTVKNEHITLASDPDDNEDFDVTQEAMDRGQRARLVRKTRTGLGLSQSRICCTLPCPGRHPSGLGTGPEPQPLTLRWPTFR